MSGITPLIDTLLHQVLGKRVDTPSPNPLNQPVKPTAPAEAARAVHSDSRLDARGPAPTAGEAVRSTAWGTQPPPTPGGASPPSALTHFSASARTIAELLGRFPAPPSAVSPAAPLMAPDLSAPPELLAQRLEGSIRDSGLFYESHLARWYQGKLPRQQLAREPQMLRTLHFTPLPDVQAGGAVSGSEPVTALAGRGRVIVPPVPFLPQGAHPRGEGAPPAPPAGPPRLPSSTPIPAVAQGQAAQPEARRADGASAGETARPPAPGLPLEGGGPEGRREAVHESLQSLVRHQLEMLATPSLRWEGDVWSGLFMALVIQLPQGRRDGREGDHDGAERDADEHGGWRSELDLQVAGLGPLKVSLWMKEVRLDIDLRIRDESWLPRLEQGLEALRQRLAGHGFEEVRLRLGPMVAEASS